MPANASCTMVVRMSCSDIFAAASFCIVPLWRLLFATTEGCTRNLGLNGLASALQTARLAYEVDTPPLRTRALSLFVNHRCRRTTFYALMRFNSPRFICMGSAESDTRVLAHAGLHLLFTDRVRWPAAGLFHFRPRAPDTSAAHACSDILAMDLKLHSRKSCFCHTCSKHVLTCSQFA